eukprot:332223-Chlamydomonas_euryale.AAC.2
MRWWCFGQGPGSPGTSPALDFTQVCTALSAPPLPGYTCALCSGFARMGSASVELTCLGIILGHPRHA